MIAALAVAAIAIALYLLIGKVFADDLRHVDTMRDWDDQCDALGRASRTEGGDERPK